MISLSRPRLRLLIGVACMVALGAPSAHAAEPTGADGARFYEQQVKPILVENCIKCHGGEEKIKGGLRLTSRASVLAGGDTGPAIDLAHPEASLLVKMIEYVDDDHQMPPRDKQLPKAKRDVLGAWVRMGAPMGTETGPDPAQLAAEARKADAEARSFWAYVKPVAPAIPAVSARAWVRQPVDAFVLASLEAAGLKPAPEAPRSVLIRRATYDLTGLPPTPQEVAAFAADPAPDAYERLIDRLLASPRYGEKWGRYWLDLVHYAETNGYERDSDKENAWRYRDYVLKAFNDDKPYDQFVREQLAGDLVDHPGPDAIVATGYYRLGLWDDEPADPEQAHYDHFDSIVSTTAQAFLGLGMGCARCHDHKKDPISQEDYYRMLGFFHGIKPYDKHNDGNTQTVIAVDAAAQADTAAKVAAARARIAAAEAEVARVTGKAGVDGKEEKEKEEKPADDPKDAQDAAKDAKAAKGAKTPKAAKAARDPAEEVLGKKAFATLVADRRTVEQLTKNPPGVQRALSASEGEWRATFVLGRGNPGSKGKAVQPGFPHILGQADPPNDGKRRLALANWIVAADNPLGARVLVNRVWQFHFGKGIVSSANDFGRFGTLPSDQRLLDWLATGFAAHGWRIKDLQRMLMTSSTYRQSAHGDPAAVAKDAGNDLNGRFSMRRLTGEELRDSILAVSGALNLRMGGPSIFPPMPKEVLATSSRPNQAWGTSTPDEARRRSVYIKVKRSLLYPILAAHDFADTDASCPQRFATIVPTQALTMLNSDLLNEQAALFAKRLRQDAPADQEAQVRRALSLAFQREPQPREIAACSAFLRDLQAKDGLTADRSLEMLALMVLNLNEFAFLE